MLFGNQVGGIMHMGRMKTAVFVALVIAVMLSFSACTAIKGSIVMNEKPFGAQFDISVNEWSAQNKCELSLEKGDEIQVEIAMESGELSVSIRGKNGSEPYTGNDLHSGTFTVTVSEADDYVVQLSGDRATGKIQIKNLSK